MGFDEPTTKELWFEKILNVVVYGMALAFIACLVILWIRVYI